VNERERKKSSTNSLGSLSSVSFKLRRLLWWGLHTLWWYLFSQSALWFSQSALQSALCLYPQQIHNKSPQKELVASLQIADNNIFVQSFCLTMFVLKRELFKNNRQQHICINFLF